MLRNILLVNKAQGLTPLQTIIKFKNQNPAYQSIKIGYAGRLDPMADGLLLLLVGDENKKRKKYEELTKQYEFCVLFGVSTDTYDLLGKITNVCVKNIGDKLIQNATQQSVGIFNQPYPPYSSKTVDGKPLYFYARANRLSEINIPTKKVNILKLNYLSKQKISKNELRSYVSKRINQIAGDFRQNEILNDWKSFFSSTNSQNFLLANFNITCTSGTYVRSISHELGYKLNTCSLSFSIKRTGIGEYKLKDALSL